MKSLLKPALISLSLLAISACSSDNDDLTPAEQDNQDLFSYLQTDYFWNRELPSSIDPSTWATMPEAMNGLRASDDKFSFVMTSEEYQDYAASVFFGYGFSHQFDEEKGGLLIRYAFDKGSAYEAGLRRGDVITNVAGTDIVDAIAQNMDLSDLFGPNEEGYTVDVTFTSFDDLSNTVIVETEFTKSAIVANTVMASQVKTLPTEMGNKNVGYLVFDSFKESSEQELEAAFEKFAAQNVEELILDLRYNSGGRISIAQQLSEQIAGQNVDNQLFVQYVHNDLLSGNNRTVYFNTVGGREHLDLDRVFVLTSEATCSSSELVINALNPFIDVVVIGDETCGKPIGMYPTEINDWVVFAINFQTQNAVGFGDYFDGLPVDCALTETIPGDWGVESEALLAEAIYYLENGQCSSAGAVGVKKATIKRTLDFTQGPIKLRNAF